MSVDTYVAGGYVSNTSIVGSYGAPEYLIHKRDIASWSEMSDAERLAWIDEAKKQVTC